MGLMFAKRRQQAAKDWKSAKAQAHEDNHKAAKDAHAKRQAEAESSAKVAQDGPKQRGAK